MKSEFLTRAELRHEPLTRKWEVVKPLIYLSALLENTVTVPRGFETDLASIPAIARGIIDPEAPCILEASIIHDRLYTKSGAGVTRAQADSVLAEAMRVLGAPEWKITLVWAAVRLFGGAHWID